MVCVNTDSIFYIVSVSFQVAGALILLLWACGSTRQKIIEKYYPEVGSANPDDDGNTVMNVGKIRKCVMEIYMNRISFFYIAVGYFLAIYGELNIKRDIAAVLICILTVFFIGVGVIISKILSWAIYRKKIPINVKEIENDIAVPLTKGQIDEMFKD